MGEGEEMQKSIRKGSAAIALALTAALAACGHHEASRADTSMDNGDVISTPLPSPDSANLNATAPIADTTTMQAHHSKLAGALVGAAAGHVAGGHAVLGAAAGALVQHERNKHEKK